jgi:hypothetical protein
MTDQAGTSIVEGFRYVRSIHRNVSKLLMSADALLSERGLLPYEGWSASHPLNFRATAPDDWLAEYFVRQFYSQGKRTARWLRWVWCSFHLRGFRTCRSASHPQ